MASEPDTTADTATSTWDVIVIGGGPPGENAAQFAIQGSDRTAVIVEEQLVGGECSYWACMPSKALLVPVELLTRARNVPGVAALVEGKTLDIAAVLARRDDFTSHHDDSSQVSWANGAGIDVIRGRGALTGPRTVEVMTPDGSLRTIAARQAVILGTGTTASVPPVKGLSEAMPWISRDVTNLHEVPKRVVVVGGGVVACEAATWLVGLGANVTMLVHGNGLLERNEPFAGQLVANELTSQGAMLHFGVSVDLVSRVDADATGEGHIHGGEVTVSYSLGGVTQTVSADEILVATGRTPASAGIGLETVGIDTAASKGFIPVDDHLGVTGVDGEWLYAVGDINGRALLTHMGKYQGRIVGAVIDARANGKSVDGPQFVANGTVPQVTFTDPSVASVGETEAQARAQGLSIETVEYEIGNVSGAVLTRDGYVGRAKLVIDSASNTIVGATFVGPDVAELVHAATISIVGEVTIDRLWHAVPSYPTMSEIWLRLLETLAEQRRAA
jgi:pyruvate/2-oxoglutarate dehydrogenase complex dihydrolipoamide dehydrogenase (E3) component